MYVGLTYYRMIYYFCVVSNTDTDRKKIKEDKVPKKIA